MFKLKLGFEELPNKLHYKGQVTAKEHSKESVNKTISIR